MPIGFDLLEKVRDLIGLETLYYGLINQELICYHNTDGGFSGGIEPQYWNTIEGRELLSSSGVVEFCGTRSIIIVSVPRSFTRKQRSSNDQIKEQINLEPDPTTSATDRFKAAGRPKSMRDRDIQDAVAALKAETAAKRLTRPKAREFLRQRFPDRHITDVNFRRIFSAVPTETGRPQKADKEL